MAGSISEHRRAGVASASTEQRVATIARVENVTGGDGMRGAAAMACRNDGGRQNISPVYAIWKHLDYYWRASSTYSLTAGHSINKRNSG